MKKVSHDKILAEKIIAKSGNLPEKDKVADRQAARRARKDEERARKIEEKRREEKELERLEQVVKPHEQSKEKMSELAMQRQHQRVEVDDGYQTQSIEELRGIAECKQIQLDEMLALDAIFMGTETFQYLENSKLENLRQSLEDIDHSDAVALRSISSHSPIAFTLQITVDDPDGGDLVAHLLLYVELPPTYPLRKAPPKFEVAYFMLTDKTMVCTANKPLETLGYLEESKFLEGLEAESKILLPDPCIYEITSSWLPEVLFSEYISMKTIA